VVKQNLIDLLVCTL